MPSLPKRKTNEHISGAPGPGRGGGAQHQWQEDSKAAARSYEAAISELKTRLQSLQTDADRDMDDLQAVKYHFFRSRVGKGVDLVKINTKEKVADMFTKGLKQDTFCYLRKKLCGW